MPEKFRQLGISEHTLHAIKTLGFETPSEIQEKAIPLVLEGKDVIAGASTGSGKTLAFGTGIIHNSKPDYGIQGLILAPTRELAVQITKELKKFLGEKKLRVISVYGGMSMGRQMDEMRNAEIVVGTPGRILDHLSRRSLNLQFVKTLVLDEADRMLDMGFIYDIKRILAKLPAKRQSLFFSATMPPEIVKLANTILTDPVKIEIAPYSKTIEVIKQAVYFVSRPDKKNLLIHILKNENVSSALVFTRTKRGADSVTKFLNDSKIHADTIHGNKSQQARQRALNNFKSNRTRVLVATDIAARGIDIEKLSHVFNYDIPDFSEMYIHRIGRTGRAGLGGTAISFCDAEERYYLKEINRLIKTPIPVIDDHPYKSGEAENNSIEIPVKKFKASKKPGSFHFSRDSKKRWVRKSRSKKW
ncbi:MAG: DEAD/DEAH box helicase [Ignavibacteria bacterium]|nr:DEAD/DEAH box helicase [Ignavibacteria bacterium]